jgi:hypothetical protein
VKPIDHRPVGDALELCGLGVRENVDETGTRSEHEECENEQREIRGQPGGHQGQAQNDDERTHPRPASSTENDPRHTCSRYRADGVHEQCKTNLPVAEMKVILESWEPGHPAAADHTKNQEGS